MKNLFAIIGIAAVTLLCFNSCNKNDDTVKASPNKISGTIEGLPEDGAPLTMKATVANGVAIGESVITNGKFSFKLDNVEEDKLNTMSLVLPGGADYEYSKEVKGAVAEFSVFNKDNVLLNNVYYGSVATEEDKTEVRVYYIYCDVSSNVTGRSSVKIGNVTYTAKAELELKKGWNTYARVTVPDQAGVTGSMTLTTKLPSRLTWHKDL